MFIKTSSPKFIFSAGCVGKELKKIEWPPLVGVLYTGEYGPHVEDEINGLDYIREKKNTIGGEFNKFWCKSAPYYRTPAK